MTTHHAAHGQWLAQDSIQHCINTENDTRAHYSSFTEKRVDSSTLENMVVVLQVC